MLVVGGRKGEGERRGAAKEGEVELEAARRWECEHDSEREQRRDRDVEHERERERASSCATWATGGKRENEGGPEQSRRLLKPLARRRAGRAEGGTEAAELAAEVEGVSRPPTATVARAAARAAALRRVIRLPLSAPPVRGQPSLLPEVAALGRLYLAAVHRLEHVSAAHAPSAYLFQLPGERPPRTVDMSSWLQTQLRILSVSAPPGFSYLGHSIRSGASSAAEAIGVSRYLGNWMGGWSQSGRTREIHYMDPSVRPSPAAFGFFGWMLEGCFETLHPTWEYRFGARQQNDPGEPTGM
ncbi:hypothetical protein AB1Y20_010527 [Prymnesium parvum]|uniref:Uncharacterized protein n=1 Tax=Prymnesium parvum TaxID=97485 RepID=A0AB34IPI1_PRYPA